MTPAPWWIGTEERADGAVARAVKMGHVMDVDPPHDLSAVRRWTCTRCGRAALDNRGTVYGDAVEKACVMPADGGGERG